MKIKEQNEQRIVIVPTIGDLWYKWNRVWVWCLMISIIASVLRPQIGTPIAVVLLLYLLGDIVGKKIVIDKPAASVIITKRIFMLVSRKHVIPFSLVLSIYAEHKTYGGGPGGQSGFEVSIETPGSRKSKTVKICPKCGCEFSTWRASCLTCGTILREAVKEEHSRNMITIFQSSKESDASNVKKMVGSLIGTDVYKRVYGG